MLNKLKKLIVGTLVGIITLSPLSVLLDTKIATAASGRDCDGNAIIRCGALTASELREKVNSNKELEHIFQTIGISTNKLKDFENGVVQKDGDVVVNGGTATTHPR